MTREYTIGRLSVINELGRTPICDTLEPPVKPSNHHLPKAIPPGTYSVVINLSPRFRQWLPLLMNVPHREGIRIHAGNSVSDTRGCILVGENLMPGRVLNSRSTLSKLMQLLNSRKEGEGVKLTVES